MSDCKHNVTVEDCTGLKVCANVDCRKVLAPSVRPNPWEIESVIHVCANDGASEKESDER